VNISSIGNQIGVPAELSSPQPVSEDQRTLVQAVKAVNAAELFGQDNELTFILDRQSKRMLTRIVNRNTGDVVMQIPPEYVVRLAEEIKGG